MKSFKEILDQRRSIRIYDANKTISQEIVKECLQLASISPNSSNMQLWEFYHIVDEKVLKNMATFCLNQNAAKTAQQLVVFVTRKDFAKNHAKRVLEMETENIRKNSPEDRQEKRIADLNKYYGKLIPFIYSSGLGIARKIMVELIGIFRPIVREVSNSDMRVVVHKSCALAAQTFMLAMADKGYDTCPMEGFDSRRIKSLLKLPGGAEINMVISCGIREEAGVYGDRVRLPFEEVYFQL